MEYQHTVQYTLYLTFQQFILLQHVKLYCHNMLLYCHMSILHYMLIYVHLIAFLISFSNSDSWQSNQIIKKESKKKKISALHYGNCHWGVTLTAADSVLDEAVQIASNILCCKYYGHKTQIGLVSNLFLQAKRKCVISP